MDKFLWNQRISHPLSVKGIKGSPTKGQTTQGQTTKGQKRDNG